MNDPIRPITFDDLLRLASHVTIPDVIVDENSIGTGQLWLAKWDTFREFVLVARADPSHPVVVPVTFDDTHELDEPDRVQTQSLGVGRAHWALPRPIPAITLGHLVEAGITLSSVSPVGNTDNPRGGDPRGDELWQDLESFDTGGNDQLHARLREGGRSPSTLARQLGVTGGEALDLLKGRLLPTPAMAESIAAMLSTTPGAVLGMLGAIPNGLRRDLAKRAFRNAVRERARQRTWSDSAAWKQVAFGTLAMPYRTTGGSADDDWESRIQRYLEVDHEP